MTSNRYLTEVLGESRETLLAFVDRIALVGFVPKGFSNPKPMQQVMRQNVAGQPPTLRAYLGIQDLDVLQDGAQHVYFSVEASHRLVAFLDLRSRNAGGRGRFRTLRRHATCRFAAASAPVKS